MKYLHGVEIARPGGIDNLAKELVRGSWHELSRFMDELGMHLLGQSITDRQRDRPILASLGKKASESLLLSARLITTTRSARKVRYELVDFAKPVSRLRYDAILRFLNLLSLGVHQDRRFRKKNGSLALFHLNQARVAVGYMLRISKKHLDFSRVPLIDFNE